MDSTIDSSSAFFRKVFLALGIVSAIGILGYGLLYLIEMPAVSPDGFIPKSLGNEAHVSFGFGRTLAIFVLMYAFGLLPVNIAFIIKHYQTNPLALVLACVLISLSLIIEIFNCLPVITEILLSRGIANVSPEVQLYLVQRDALRFLAFDVAGFSLAYMGFFIYSIVYFKSCRVFSYTIIGSIVAFIANVPFLWLAPKGAIILMVVSILAFALFPVYLAWMTIKK